MAKPKKESYIFVPERVMDDARLSSREKLIYCMILALNGTRDGCYATNRYFAERFGVSISSVTRALARLEELGYIRRDTNPASLGRRFIRARMEPAP